jgi:hypothetical protein
MPTSQSPSFLSRMYHRYTRWDIRRRKIFWATLTLLSLSIPALLPGSIHIGRLPRTNLYFLPVADEIISGQQFTVELRMDASSSVNAVGTVMHFDQKHLEILQMTTAQSFCSFYTENTFDTIKGEVHLSCGTPNPGFSGDTLLFRLTMRPKLNGVTDITLDPKQTLVLANNGKGNNTAGALPHLTINVPQTY